MRNDKTIFLATPPVVSKEDIAYEALKEAIISGKLKPNTVVNQSQVASMLDLSTIPVRSAISRLVSEGLLTQEPHHSPRVSPFSPEQINEVLIIRGHLEILATAEAIPHIGPDELAELRSMVEEMRVALESQDLYRFGTLNKAFHLKTYAFCPLPLLQQMIRDLWAKTDIHHSRSMFIMVPELAYQSHKEHEELLDLIETGNAAAAAELTHRHKTRAMNLFLKALKEMPNDEPQS